MADEYRDTRYVELYDAHTSIAFEEGDNTGFVSRTALSPANAEDLANLFERLGLNYDAPNHFAEMDRKKLTELRNTIYSSYFNLMPFEEERKLLHMAAKIAAPGLLELKLTFTGYNGQPFVEYFTYSGRFSVHWDS